MAQTVLNYNDLMFGIANQTFIFKEKTITGAVALLKGTIMVRGAVGIWKSAVDADKIGAAEIPAGWGVLLADVDPSGGDTLGNIGTSGGVFRDLLIAGTGLVYDTDVDDKLEINNIYVQNGTNSAAIAGEGA